MPSVGLYIIRSRIWQWLYHCQSIFRMEKVSLFTIFDTMRFVRSFLRLSIRSIHFHRCMSLHWWISLSRCAFLPFSAYSPNFVSSVINLLDYFLGHELRKYFSFQRSQHKMLLVLKTDSKNISATFNRAYPPYLDAKLNSLTIIKQSIQRMCYLLSIYTYI